MIINRGLREFMRILFLAASAKVGLASLLWNIGLDLAEGERVVVRVLGFDKDCGVGFYIETIEYHVIMWNSLTS